MDKPHSEAPNTVTTGGNPKVEPSVSADPESGAQPAQKQQGADRPHEDPDDQDEPSEDKTDFPKDPNDHSGEPLSNRVKEGGEASKTDEGDEEDAGGTGPSKGEGTGEKYVKSTGVAAEGGTFDAAAPGAGREADRLLDEKGVKRSGPPGQADEGGSDPLDPTNKPGVADKIKDKLHVGGH